jgi:hypothetical protein
MVFVMSSRSSCCFDLRSTNLRLISKAETLVKNSTLQPKDSKLFFTLLAIPNLVSQDCKSKTGTGASGLIRLTCPK